MSSAAFSRVPERRVAALRLFGAALLAGGLGATPWSASAAVSASAEASIDWPSLTITTIGDISLVFDSQDAGTQYNSVGIDTTNGFNGEFSADWNVGTRIFMESFAGGTLTSTLAYTPPAGPSLAEQTMVHAESRLVPGSFDARYADAEATRGGGFSVVGEGVLVFSIDYSLSLLTEGNDFFSSAYARAAASAFVSKTDGETTVFSRSEATLENPFDYFGGGFYLDAELGSADRLVVAMAFHDGERGSFGVSSDAYVEAVNNNFAPVPLPASGLLMALPLTLMALRRRPQARVD